MRNLKQLFSHPGWGELKKHIESEIKEIEEIILDKDNSPTIEEVDENRNKREAFLFLLNIDKTLLEEAKEIDYESSL